MSKTVVLFPGQGSQFTGMSKVLKEAFPWTSQIYEEASDALKIDLFKLCAEGPDSELQLTMNQQPAILTTSYAWFSVVKKLLGFSPDAGAGHSLGEYTAYLASGALTLSDAVKLVRLRGQLMQEAVPHGKGKMAAVLGLDDLTVKLLCEEATDGEHSLVVAANFNAPSQVVIAGHTTAVDKAAEITTKDPKFKARKVIPLNVSAPFHSPLMKPVAEKFEMPLASVKWGSQAFAIVNNLDAKLRTEGNPVPILRDQINNAVLWTSSMGTLKDSGHTRFIEMGPGRVLSGLVKRTLEGIELFNIESSEDIKKLEGRMK